jgi:L-Ala-D/L-Glu epimerase
MKVVELTAVHVRIPLRRPIRHASHRRTETDNVIVRCVLDDGTVGHGEGVPRDYVTGETIDSCLDTLRRADLAAQAGPWADFDAALAGIERLTLPESPGDERGIANNAARCALELALLDACGRHSGVPLSEVTKRLAPDIHSPRPWVRYSGVITSSTGLKMRLLALLQRLYGFHHLKVKVGIAGQDDVRRLRTIRRCVGGRMSIRIDANEAWTPAEVVERIRELEPAGLGAVEQPVPHEQVECLAGVRRQIQTPIMLDESLCGAFDARRAIDGGLCDVFNLRLSKCGGFIPSLRLAQMARNAGLACQLGCQVGETAILSAAGRHFATSVDGLRYVEGSYDRHLVWERLSQEDITFGRGGRAPALIGCGLGVTIDPARVEWVTKRKEKLIG